MAATVIFLRWPIKEMPHLFCFVFFLVCLFFFFVVVVDRAIKSNYRVINEKLSRDKSNIIT